MSIVNHEYKHCFIHVPKVAGTSMESFEWVTGYGHENVNQLKPPQDYFLWCFVRHPADRLLSVWNMYVQLFPKFYKKNPIIDVSEVDNFEDWVKALHNKRYPFRMHSHPQVSYIGYDTEDREYEMNFIGRFENLSEDWIKVQKAIGIDPKPLPHENSTKHRPWQECMNTGTRELIKGIYDIDYEVLGYEI